MSNPTPMSPVLLSRYLGQQYPPTDQQAAVIGAEPGPLLVVAGAGAGKTHTKAAREVWLVANGYARPDEVLGLTFTRKAAQEMGKRIRDRLGSLAANTDLVRRLDPSGELADNLQVIAPSVSTYDSYAGELIREYGLLVPVEPDARLITDAELHAIATDVVVNYSGGLITELGSNPSLSTVVEDLLALTTAMRRCPDARPPDELLALGRLADDLGFGPAGLPGLPPGRSCDAGAGPASSGASAWALTVRGRDRERAVGLARAALSAVDADRTVPAMPRVVAALTLEAAGHVPEAVRALRHLLLEITRDRWAPPAVLALSAMVGLRSGDLDAARSDLAGAAASRSAAASPLVAAVRTLLHVEQGDRDAAASAAFDDDVAAGGRPGTALLEYARGRVRLGEGRPREAGELFMRCGRMLLDRGRVNPALVPWRSACAAAFHAAADDVAARRMAADERRRAEQWGAPGPVAVADAALRALDGPPVREVARAARS